MKAPETKSSYKQDIRDIYDINIKLVLYLLIEFLYFIEYILNFPSIHVPLFLAKVIFINCDKGGGKSCIIASFLRIKSVFL